MARAAATTVTLAACAWLLVWLAGPAAPSTAGDSVLVTRVQGPITPVVAEHVRDAVTAAAAGGHQALLIELDTPGGLDTSMRTIVQDLLTAELPVIVFVTPPGARAASAGAVITLAAHVAAMAPGTNIGAATPIDLQGGEVIDKVVNDAAAYVQAIAEARQRPADFAVDMVREGRSVAASEAVDIGAVDLVADDRAALLAALDGRTVALTAGADRVLRTGGAAVERFDMSALRALLQRLADPNLAFLLISIGTLAIIYELANPGIGLGGVLGAIMLILAFFSLSVLPVNVAGLLLVLLAAALFVGEAFAPGLGAFAGGGTIALLAAGIFLFQRPTGIGVDPGLLIPVAAIVGAGTLAVARIAYTSRHAPQTAGAAGTMVGTVGTVKQAGDALQVQVEGARWQAHSTGPAIAVGQRVRVVAMDGLDLLVEPLQPDPRPDGPQSASRDRPDRPQRP